MLWFSLYDHNEYKSNDKPFVDMNSYQGISDLQNGWELVFNEFKNYSQVNTIESHFNTMMVEKPKSWRVRSLRVWGTEMYDVQKHFPETMKLLNTIPNVVSMGFNILEPNSKIKPHCGDTNAIYRCHLGLQIPKDYKTCGIKVLDEERHWMEGKVIGFEDAFKHEAWNNSQDTRIILLFDVLKPEYASQKNKICATILASFYLQQLGNVIPKLYEVNRSFFKFLLFPFVLFLRLAIPIRNRLKK